MSTSPIYSTTDLCLTVKSETWATALIVIVREKQIVFSRFPLILFTLSDILCKVDNIRKNVDINIQRS